MGIAVTAACLVAAFWGLPLADVGSAFRRANYFTLPLMLACLATFYWLKAIRWRLLLEPQKKLRTMDVLPALMIGFMGNNLLPAHLGEFIRVYVLGREQKLSKTAVLATVVLERVLDIIAILSLMVISLLTVDGLPVEYVYGSIFIGAGTIALCLVLAAYVAWTEWFLRVSEFWMRRVFHLPERFAGKIMELLAASPVGLHALRSPRLMWGIIVTSFAQWVLNGATVLIALKSFGQEIPPLASFFVVGVIAFGVTVPSTPGFFGVIQLCFKLAVAPFNVSEADALAASIYYHISQYIPVTLTGLYFLNRAGLRLGQLEQAAEAERAAEHAGTAPIDGEPLTRSLPAERPVSNREHPTG